MSTDTNQSWSVGLGRWGGTPVRLHMLFFVFAAFTFYFGWYANKQGIATVAEYTALTSLVILLFSVVLHELGHLFVVSRYRCRIYLVELLPWGGCSRFDSPRHPPSRFLIHAAGPAVNLFLCVACGFLLMQTGDTDWDELQELLNPIRPSGLLGDDFMLSSLKIGFWINWLLFLTNLIPVFPFDGGNILRSAVPFFWRRATAHQAYMISLLFAQFAAFSLFAFAWLLRDSNPNELVPTWFVLVMLGIIVFFSSKRQAVLDSQQLEEADLARVTSAVPLQPGDVSSLYYDLADHREGHGEGHGEGHSEGQGEGHSEGQGGEGGSRSDSMEDQFRDEFHEDGISDWLQQHKHDRQQPDSHSEADEDRRVDEILAKLHQTGMNSLSTPERELLQRVSARYREKQQSGDQT